MFCSVSNSLDFIVFRMWHAIRGVGARELRLIIQIRNKEQARELRRPLLP